MFLKVDRFAFTRLGPKVSAHEVLKVVVMTLAVMTLSVVSSR